MEKARVETAEQINSAQEEADLVSKNFLEAVQSLEKLGLETAGNHVPRLEIEQTGMVLPLRVIS